MTKVEELGLVVASLTVKGYEEFRRWFLENDWEKWEQKIEEDSRAGNLDFFAEDFLCAWIGP